MILQNGVEKADKTMKYVHLRIPEEIKFLKSQAYVSLDSTVSLILYQGHIYVHALRVLYGKLPLLPSSEILPSGGTKVRRTGNE